MRGDGNGSPGAVKTSNEATPCIGLPVEPVVLCKSPYKTAKVASWKMQKGILRIWPLPCRGRRLQGWIMLSCKQGGHGYQEPVTPCSSYRYSRCVTLPVEVSESERASRNSSVRARCRWRLLLVCVFEFWGRETCAVHLHSIHWSQNNSHWSLKWMSQLMWL